VYNLGGGQSGGDGLCVLKKAPTVREIGDATNQWLNGLAVGAGGGPGGNFIYEREADAFGHCWAACVLCRRCGEFATAFAGWGRELKREWWDGPDRDGREHDSFWQDSGTCGEECAEAHSSGELDLTAPVTIRFWNIARKGWEIIRNRAPSLPY
jgi:hypothetical protein